MQFVRNQSVSDLRAESVDLVFLRLHVVGRLADGVWDKCAFCFQKLILRFRINFHLAEVLNRFARLAAFIGVQNEFRTNRCSLRLQSPNWTFPKYQEKSTDLNYSNPMQGVRLCVHKISFLVSINAFPHHLHESELGKSAAWRKTTKTQKPSHILLDLIIRVERG